MKKRHVTLFILLLLMTIQLFATDPFGKKVSAVQWDSPLQRKRFERLILIKKGDILNPAVLRRTIKLLYATGKLRQISATADFDAEGGVALSFHAAPNHFIASIHIKGNKHISDKKIRSDADLHKRVLWEDNNANDIREKIVLLYQREGYPHPRVTLETVYLSAWKVRINITLVEGERERIQKFNYSGNCYPKLSHRIQTQISLEYKSEPLTSTAFVDISNKITEILEVYGYRTPVVEVDRSGDNSVGIRVEHGPVYQLTVEGNSAFSTKTLTNYIIGLNRKVIQKDKTKKKLLLLYQLFGFPDVSIDFVVDEHIDAVRGIIRNIRCHISEGSRSFILHYRFNGNHDLDSKMLQKRIGNFMHDLIGEQKFPQLYSNSETVYGTKKQSYHDKVSLPTAGMAIAPDFFPLIQDFIKSVYREEGYLEAVVPRVALEREGEKLIFVVDITEFSPTMISTVEVVAKDEEFAYTLKQKLRLKGGVPYNKQRENEYKNRIAKEMVKRGFLYASIGVSTTRDGNKIRIRYELDNITPVRAGVVVFNGNYKTSDWLLKRMVRFHPGDVITEDHLRRSRRNLQNTGFFNFVRISFIDDNLPSLQKDIVVTVQESNAGRISPGIGVSTDEGGFVFGKFQFTNIGGSGLTLKTGLKIGRKIDYFMPSSFRTLFQDGFSEWEKIDRNITVSLLMPDMLIFPVQITMQVDAFHIHLIKSNAGYPYLKEKNGMMLLFYRRFLEHYFLSLGNEFFYQNEREYNQLSQRVDIERLLIKPQFKAEIDFRNNLFFPSQGVKVWFAVENQTALAGTSGSFTKLENSVAGYLPLIYKQNYTGKYIPQDTLIFHAFFNFSIIFLHDGTLSSDDALKLGGSSSMRGYYSEMMFPQDNQTKDARGTLVYYLRNELRLKLYDNIYLSAFLDMGNIWQDLDNLGDHEAFRFSAGSGVAYVSPIGSLNLQLGFNLNPRSYEDRFAIHAYISSQ